MNPLRIATAVVGGWAGLGVFVLLVVHVPIFAMALVTHGLVLAAGYGLGRPARMELHMCHLQLDRERAAAAVIEGAAAIAPERPEPIEPPAWVLDPPYLQDRERGVGA